MLKVIERFGHSFSPGKGTDEPSDFMLFLGVDFSVSDRMLYLGSLKRKLYSEQSGSGRTALSAATSRQLRI